MSGEENIYGEPIRKIRKLSGNQLQEQQVTVAKIKEHYSWKDGKYVCQPNTEKPYRRDITTDELRSNKITTLTVLEHIPDDIYLLADSLLSLTLTKMTYQLSSELHKLNCLKIMEFLDLTRNQQFPEGLPSAIGGLQSLKRLELVECNLEHLHDSMSKLDILEVLRLDTNNFSAGLPEVACQLKSLHTLGLGNCRLKSLPDEMRDLTHLKDLTLTGNSFGADGLPKVLCEISSLQILNLRDCRLETLPDNLANLADLEELALCRNKFKDGQLPDVVCQLSGMKRLYLDECRLSKLPDKLEKVNLDSLSITGNRITSLPPVILSMKGLVKSEHHFDAYRREACYDCAIGRYGFIFYNPIDRPGAEEEAKALESGLNAVACQVTRHKWTSQVELDNLIDNEIKKAASGSLVIVCIMAHGGPGTLGYEDGEIFISDLLVQLAKPLPADLPMVILIQACQKTGKPGSDSDAQVSSGPDMTKFDLRRPHTALLMATVDNEVARRGLYTGAMAEELERADGVSDISDLHRRAVKKVIAENASQTPIIRSTLRKKLTLEAIQ